MANLEFFDTHNMVAYLHKTEGSKGFHQIVDFLNTSHIKYALTKNPTIYVSLIQQFWQTAAANTLDSREVQIIATIYGKVKLVSKASIRRNLKLEESDGITTFPNTKIFEQLTLMGYVSNSDKLTFQKGHFSPQWRFLIHTILHCLSPKKSAWEQFSSNIATAIICLATNRTFNFSKMIFEGMVKNLDSKSKFLMFPRFIQIFLNKHKRHLLPHNRTYIAPTLTQKLFSNIRRASKGYNGMDIPLFPTMLVQVDEAAFISVDVVHGGAATTVTSIDAGHGSGNIPKSPTMPHDSPLPRGHTPGSDEGSMTLHDLMVLCTKLLNKVDSLETELKQTKQTYGVALTKLIKKVKKLEQTIKTSQARTRAKIVVLDDVESSEDTSKQGRMIEDIDQDAGISLVTPTKVSSQEDQSEDQLGVLSATKVLADAAKKNVNTYTRRRRAVSIGSEEVSTASRIFSTAEESVSTAGTSMPVSTAGMVQQVNIIIPSSSKTTKDKEQETKFNAEQEELLASETTEDEANPPVADIDWDDVQAQIQADEDLAQKLLQEERENLSIEERAILLTELIDKRKK
ncbi:hypothetical protein Tco_0226588 [Tanacetum coccineum]